MGLLLFVEVLSLSFFGMHYFMSILISIFAIILTRKRELVVLLLLSIRCLVTVNVPWLLLTMLWVGLQCVIVIFSDHTHLLSYFLEYLGSQVNGAMGY